jgi:NhaA family Na+:H+ antiporter
MAQPTRILRAFLNSEAAGGLVLMVSAALAIGVANSPAGEAYFVLLHSSVLGLSVLHWVNDALMALFFLLVGLEIKREFVLGQLASWQDRALPGFAALGGIAVPAVIYVLINLGSPQTMAGWAIPTATDIAFSLGVLALLGARVPLALKVFLAALAIIDDLAAIVVIAVFYTAAISPVMLGLAALVLAGLVVMNASGVRGVWAYLVLGAVLWFLILRSGIHATIAGVLLAMTIPCRTAEAESERSPLHVVEDALAPWVAFGVLPLFGFANAGVALAGAGLASFASPVTLGAALGLFVGKPVGVLAGAGIAIRAGLARPPDGIARGQFTGVAILCGIGFTMSLFIGLLAFGGDANAHDTKIGVLAGSLASAIVGYCVLRFSAPAKSAAPA